ncbi:MAG: glycosyltransferase family 1 protein [Patescibacteria group bacterium]|jgi:glycosyltransferase involved in cell wall biosynthesis
MQKVFVYDPTLEDKQSSVRGVGRYLQVLKENFPEWTFTNKLATNHNSLDTVFINPFFNFLQKPLTLRRIANKQIAVIHDLIPLKYPSHFPAGIRGTINIVLNKFALRNYDLIITDSEASKKEIIDILGLSDKKIKVVYPCLPKVFSMKYKVSSIKKINNEFEILNTKYFIPNTSFCLYVGDATWNKNLVALARAIKIANVNCVFVGKVFGNNNHPILNHPWNLELKQFFELTKDDKRFIFAGFVPDSELIKLYQQASFNILPSRDEGFGFSYLEAANFGCPSLLSGIPVLREISAGNALYIDQKDPDKIAEKIKEINYDKILRKRLSDYAKKRSKFFSAEKFREEIRSVLVSEST